jgi:hypothetical protein
MKKILAYISILAMSLGSCASHSDLPIAPSVTVPPSMESHPSQVTGSEFAAICDSLLSDLLPSLDMAIINNTSEMETWLQGQPRFDNAKRNNEGGWSWSTERAEYYSTFLKDSRSVYIRWTEVSPTVSLILTCLGAPTFYDAVQYQPPDRASAISGDLWYIKRGLVFSFHTELGESVSNAIGTMHVVPPGAIEDLVINKQPNTPPENILKHIKTWPGGADRITFDADQ